MFVKIWGQVTTTLLTLVSLSIPKSNSFSSCFGNEAFPNTRLTFFVRPFEIVVVFSTSKVCSSSDQTWICLSIWDNGWLFSIKILIFSLCFIRLLPCISTIIYKINSLVLETSCFLVVTYWFVCADEGSEVESEIDEELDESGEPQAKREKTELNQAFQVGCMQPVLESGVQQNLLNPIHNEHIVATTQTIRQCSATGNTYTAV